MRTGDDQSRADDDQLPTLIDRARRSGVAFVADDKAAETFYLARLGRYSGATPALFDFDAAERLLEPPQARAAYSDRTAWLMASLAELAYIPHEQEQRDEEKLSVALGAAGFVLRSLFNDPESGTQAFLAQRPGAFAVLAFRGTEKDRKDILTDLNAAFYHTAAGKAHKGFRTAYGAVRADILSALSTLWDVDEPPVPLFITGHSLGGALATVATLDLEEKHLLSACYTFGSPRVGDSEWSDALKTPLYRVVNSADGVPLVPGSNVTRWVLGFVGKIIPPLSPFLEAMLRKGFAGFQHAGDFRLILGDDTTPRLKTGTAATWARLWIMTLGRFAEGVRGVPGVRRLFGLRGGAVGAYFADHSIQRYRERLRLIAETRNA